MRSAPTATEMAFLQIAVLQAVVAMLWGLGVWLAHAERAALAHGSVYAGSSAVTWALLALTFRSPPPLRVVLLGVCSVIALRRGIRLYIGPPQGWATLALALSLLRAVSPSAAARCVRRWRPKRSRSR
jgi:hypothetical protein